MLLRCCLCVLDYSYALERAPLKHPFALHGRPWTLLLE